MVHNVHKKQGPHQHHHLILIFLTLPYEQLCKQHSFVWLCQLSSRRNVISFPLDMGKKKAHGVWDAADVIDAELMDAEGEGHLC